MSKWDLTFEIIKTMGMLYEVRFQGPKKLGAAMERFYNLRGVLDYMPQEWLNANDAASEFLDYIYTGSPEPEWLKEAEYDSKRT
jgi:hypothetical protein